MVNIIGVTIPFSISAKQWFPLPETLTGTFTSTGRLVKAGTTPIKSREELQVGDWLLNPANDEIRKITDISNELNSTTGAVTNQLISVETAFTTPFTNIALSRVRNGQIKKLEYVFAGGTTGTARSAYSVNALGTLGVKYEAESEGGIIPMLLTPGATSTVNGIYKQ